MRACAIARTAARSARSLTPSVSVASATTCAGDREARGAQERQDVGQVALALGVVGAARRQRRPQRAGVEAKIPC